MTLPPVLPPSRPDSPRPTTLFRRQSSAEGVSTLPRLSERTALSGSFASQLVVEAPEHYRRQASVSQTFQAMVERMPTPPPRAALPGYGSFESMHQSDSYTMPSHGQEILWEKVDERMSAVSQIWRSFSGSLYLTSTMPLGVESMRRDAEAAADRAQQTCEAPPPLPPKSPFRSMSEARRDSRRLPSPS